MICMSCDKCGATAAISGSLKDQEGRVVTFDKGGFFDRTGWSCRMGHDLCHDCVEAVKAPFVLKLIGNGAEQKEESG